jgi:hypothetical protein
MRPETGTSCRRRADVRIEENSRQKAYIEDVFRSEGSGVGVEELICSVEFLRSRRELVARVSSEAGGVREYHAPAAGTVIEQVVDDLQEEFESAPVT